MSYYLKGGSNYNTGNKANVWVAVHLSGYTPDHYTDLTWKNFNKSGAQGDPYWRLGGDGGQNYAEIGLSGSYRIKIAQNGIFGYNPENSLWTGLMSGGGGGASQLSDLIDVENIDYTEGYVLRADGDTYDSAQLSHSDLGSVGNNDHHIPTAINDTPTDGETTTGVSSNWAYDHLQEFNAVSGDYASTSGTIADYPTVSGSHANISGIVASKQYEINGELGADGNYNGIYSNIDTAEGAFGSGMFLSGDGDYYMANASGLDTKMLCTAIFIASNKVMHFGTIRHDAWDWTPSAKLYVSTTDGEFTESPTTGAGDIIQCIGHALTADSVLFNPANDWVEVTGA